MVIRASRPRSGCIFSRGRSTLLLLTSCGLAECHCDLVALLDADLGRMLGHVDRERVAILADCGRE